MTTTALQAAAVDYVKRGFAITWMGYGDKFPRHEGWNTIPKVVTTPEQARKVWNGTPLNIGVVHGLGTVKTCSLDADRVQDARDVLAEFGIDLDELCIGVPMVEGKPGNFRLLYRQPAGLDLPLVKLEWPDPDNSKSKVTVFELRAGANQDVLPPSRHPSGKLYEWMTPLPADPPDMPEPPPALLELWRNWESWRPELQTACPWASSPEPKASPRPKEARPHVDVIGQFNAAHDVAGLLEANGYKRKGRRRFLPPNSTSGVPSVRILDSGKVFSTNGSCLLNDGHAHDAFSTFCILEHGGEVQSAVKAAAALLGIELKQDHAPVRSEAPAGYQAERDARRNAGDSLNPYRGTDDANADLLLALHGSDIRYCPPWDKWLIWSGSHWRIDELLDIDQRAVDVSRSLRERAITLTRQRQSILEEIAALLAAMNATAGAFESLGPQHARLVKQQTELGSEIDWLMKLSGKLEGTAKRATMLIAARHKVVVHHSDLDKGHFLLNASNGTVDLRSAALRPHERLDLLTHDAAIQYDPAATCPTWTRFLLEVFAGDADLIEFVRRAIGYSLTGDVREQVLLICHGSGSNGKSVFLNILRKLLGRLALQAAPDLLMADHNRRHPTEQADLYGRRAVVCQETEENRRFNEVLVKQLTGGDSVRARRMREDFWEFEPTWKIWLSTNHRPEIRGTDHAIWRRVRLIPFTVTFHDAGKGEPVKDPAMEEKLTAELPGILAWAVQGCLAWQRDGLPTPKAVHDATEEYRDQQDVMAAWLKDCCIIKKLADAKAADLYASYSAWCEANGERPEPQRRFGMRLTERGFQRQKRMVGHFWLGVGLLAPDHHDRYDPNDPDSAKKQLEEKEAFPEALIGEIASFGSFESCAHSKAPEPPPVDTPPQDIPPDITSAPPAETQGKPSTCAANEPDMPTDKPAPPIKPLSPLDGDIVAYLSRVATTATDDEIHRQVNRGQQGRTLALVRVALHKLVQGGLVDKINNQFRLAGARP